MYSVALFTPVLEASEQKKLPALCNLFTNIPRHHCVFFMWL